MRAWLRYVNAGAKDSRHATDFGCFRQPKCHKVAMYKRIGMNMKTKYAEMFLYCSIVDFEIRGSKIERRDGAKVVTHGLLVRCCIVLLRGRV